MQMKIFEKAEFGKIRAMEKDGTVWFVGKDVAEVLGYSNSRKAIITHIDDEDKGVTKWDTLGGEQEMVIINESGLYSLILSSKLPKAKEFKHWVTAEVLPAIRKTGSYSVQNKSVGSAIADIGIAAEHIQALFAVKRGIALSQAIDLVGINNNLKLGNLKQLLPPADHNTGFLNATQLGEKLGGWKARVVNKFLEQKGFQYKENNYWRLTSKGLEYGEEMPYTKNGHSGYQIRWNQKILNALLRN